MKHDKKDIDVFSSTDIEAESKNKALSRREMLRKGGRLASILPLAAFIGSDAVAQSSSGSVTINSSDYPEFYNLTQSNGIRPWDFINIEWSQNGPITSGTFYFRTGGGRWGTTMYPYSFAYRTAQDADNLLDLDTTTKPLRLIALYASEPNYRVYAPTYGPGRRLFSQYWWDSNWRIPNSWQQEFLNWNTVDPASGCPNFAVVVTQYGNVYLGGARRMLVVYQLSYTRIPNTNNYMRTVTTRRVMNILAGYYAGSWTNVTLDYVDNTGNGLMNELGGGVVLQIGMVAALGVATLGLGNYAARQNWSKVNAAGGDFLTNLLTTVASVAVSGVSFAFSYSTGASRIESAISAFVGQQGIAKMAPPPSPANTPMCRHVPAQDYPAFNGAPSTEFWTGAQQVPYVDQLPDSIDTCLAPILNSNVWHKSRPVNKVVPACATNPQPVDPYTFTNVENPGQNANAEGRNPRAFIPGIGIYDGYDL